MRILTWNVNVLRTTLDYHPWSSMKNKSVEGLLDELGADIYCFQEHKTRRPQVDKAMACPGKYDGFWTWPRSRTGYSGVCTYVNSTLCVPLRAEEGITGLLLKEAKGSTIKPPWTDEEMVGLYADISAMDFMDEVDGAAFNPRELDMEGRAVVCDFGMFVLFNLYCPNETNETRRPYKMNFLHVLQARVEKLVAAGREVIVAGDMNVMRAPIDSGEGGIRSTAEQHYEHPARRWFDAWCAPKGPMIDVVRESHPDREGMFTCWNTKIDARSANYGSRIDYILCTPGLRPWIKGGDIQAELFGSDHCPVYIDLHDSITTDDGTTLHIRDMLNPPNRPPSTAPIYPSDIPRDAPEPPRFATKFLEEFSAKQRTLMSLWGKKKSTSASASPSQGASPAPEEKTGENGQSQTTHETQETQRTEVATSTPAASTTQASSTLGMARVAFDSLDKPAEAPSPSLPTLPSPKAERAPAPKVPVKRPITVDLTADDDEPPPKKIERTKPAVAAAKGKGKAAVAKGSQPKLAAFWSTPAPAKNTPKAQPSRSESASAIPASVPTSLSSSTLSEAFPSVEFGDSPNIADIAEVAEVEVPDTDADELLAQAIAQEDQERQRERDAKKEQAAPVWSNLFAKKLPPLCIVHQKPCKDFSWYGDDSHSDPAVVKIQGPNKGKRFWLCSMPVGPGYDTGRSKRPREEVDRQYKCDFFLWDSANSRKETPKAGPS